jgi:cytochrome c
MKLKTLPVLAALCISAAALADEPVGFDEGSKLVGKYQCQACHSTDKTMDGPSFHDIAKRYGSDPNAQAEVSEHILNGSSGAWGPRPMPSTAIPDAELKMLVEWILSLNHD